jgi:hypothetical protein
MFVKRQNAAPALTDLDKALKISPAWRSQQQSIYFPAAEVSL